MKLGEALYKSSAEAGDGDGAGDSDETGTGAAGAESKGGDDEVVDADFEEVDDDKKGKTA